MEDLKSGDYVTLKWGTLKSWNIQDEETFKLLERYLDDGTNVSAMMQKDSVEQKEILCQIIDRIGKPVYLDWDGEYVSVEDAKKYVMEYGK